MREVTRWTDETEAALQGALDSTNCVVFRSSEDGDIEDFTETVVGFIVKVVDDTFLRRTIRTFSNQKSWVDKSVMINHGGLQGCLIQGPQSDERGKTLLRPQTGTTNTTV